MSTLVIAAHVDPHAAAPSFRAALPEDVELRAFALPGLSSAYDALAARLRSNGRILPALVEHAGAEADVEDYERIVFLSWSAPYALARALLANEDDAAALAGWVALDSGYGQPSLGTIDLARRARAGEALYWAGFTDVPTAGYLSSGAFLAEVQRQAGEPDGLFRVEHWAHDPAAYAAAPDKGAFWRSEHIGALHRGPAFLVAALAALGQDTSPAQRARDGRDREAVLDLARAALAGGVHERPPGSNRGPEVDAYLHGCVRAGRPLRVSGVSWCAAFVSWCLWRAAFGDGAEARALAWTPAAHAATGDVPPVGWRAAVAELVADARSTGAWHDLDDGAEPAPGDLLVMGRDGHDPRHGGEGHVAIVDELADGGYQAIGGNEGNAVGRTLRGASTPVDLAEPIVGWIEIGT